MESANDNPASIDNVCAGRGLSQGNRGFSRKDGTGRLYFKAAIFDMDGVVTNTAAVHSAAWKEMFDAYLRSWAAIQGKPFAEFTLDGDYLAYVDGRPRYNGVERFLKSRGIELPRGNPDDPPGIETVCGLGNRKNVIFKQILERDGVRTFESTVLLMREMIQRGIKIGLATSSFNSGVVLGKTGTTELFETVVDGVVSAKRGLKGKPEPDIFSATAGNLGVPNAEAIVIEDAISGVQAGAKGGFALVVGIAREGDGHELRRNGADVVVRDLSETSLEAINRLVQEKRAAVG